MDIRKLQVLLTVIETGSLTKTAKIYKYTQSGITHMMAGLEKELGIDILIRDYSGVKLTEAGKELLPYIKSAVQEFDRFESHAEQLNSNENRTLIIGAYSSIFVTILPKIIERFEKMYPRVNIEMQTAPNIEGLCNGIITGEFDVGFGTRQDSPGIRWYDLYDDPMLAILPKDYETTSNTFDVKNFNGEKFLMPSFGFDRDIMHVLDKYDVKPDVKSSTVDDSAIISMVGVGLGISILTELVIEAVGIKEAKYIRLNPDSHRTISIGVKPGRRHNPYLKALINISKDYIGKEFAPERGLKICD